MRFFFILHAGESLKSSDLKYLDLEIRGKLLHLAQLSVKNFIFLHFFCVNIIFKLFEIRHRFSFRTEILLFLLWKKS